MRDHHKKNIETYNREAGTLARVYNGMASTDVLPGLAQRLPVSRMGARLHALDMGCGSGRDAYWLAEQKGFEVTAMDASTEMLMQARRLKAHPHVRYVEDTLPYMRKVMEDARRTGVRYDVFLMSAVWMHLRPEERGPVIQNMAALAAGGALGYISLRHGPAPADRPMFENSVLGIRRLADSYGATVDVVGSDRDRQGRGDVKWEYVALKFRKGLPSGPF